jgi:hypothetical protein
MRLIPGALGACSIIAALLLPTACLALDQDQLKLLHDPHGWQYVSIFDRDYGMQMQHQCFVEGDPSQGACRGMLYFASDGTFRQTVTVHGSTLERHGTYHLDGDQLSFQDELGTKDGPYTLEINTDAKTMRFSMRQAGVLIGANLKLKNAAKKPDTQKHSVPQ